MYGLRKSKKGFTLIELMVVVAIIGVLVLLGLRAYSSQKERACNAIAKANASTFQTMLVGYMGDHDITVSTQIPTAIGELVTVKQIESMINPYSSDYEVYEYTNATAYTDQTGWTDETNQALHRGKVDILFFAPNQLLVNARGKRGEILLVPNNALPANKY